ncbi:unnamed protein product [Tenebrio molitor]|nr:unnamed protein product [Tenebrio molitor]
MAENEIKSLKSKRAQLRARLTRFATFIQNSANHQKPGEIKTRLDGIRVILNEFEDVHAQLKLLYPSEVNEKDIEEFANEYFKFVCEAQNLANLIQNHVKLPNIQIPCFNNDFIDTRNQHLSAIQKFHYLRSSLKAVASETIEHLMLSTDNYAAAWELLKWRFENTRLITQHHVRGIFALPVVNKESKSLRQLLHGLTLNIEALEAINRPVQHWDDWFI